MAGEPGPKNQPVTRRYRTAAIVVIAVLPPTVLLVLASGIVARARAIISGTKVASPPLLLAPGAVYIALAWVIFFAVLALIYARDAEPKGSEPSEPKPCGGDTEPEFEPEIIMDALRTAAADKPKGGGDALPTAQNLLQAQALLEKGSELRALGRYEEAITHFDETLLLCPRLAGAWAAKGLACHALGRYQEAIRCYEESLRFDPSDAAVWNDKGNSLCAIGRLEGALNCFNEALIADQRDERAWYNKGICLANLGRTEEALHCCTKAVEIDPSFAAAWEAKAMLEERLGRMQDAVASYGQFMALASASDVASTERVRQHVRTLEADVHGPEPAATAIPVRECGDAEGSAQGNGSVTTK